MAVETYTADALEDGARPYPVDDHGKIRIQFFNVPAAEIDAVGDIGSLFNLCKLPAGRVRVLPSMSKITHSAWGAARTLNIGHTLYDSSDTVQEAADDDAFAAALDMATASQSAALSGVLKYDLYSKSGVLVQAKLAGGTVPIGASLSGYIAYIYE